MRSSSFFLFFFLFSCGGRSPSNAEEISLIKQKQKIVLLQKKLYLAEKEERKVKEKMEKLCDEMRETELGLIRRQIDDYEELIQKTPSKRADFESSTLFLKERERLYWMIRNGKATSEAQIVLDRILQLVTELSDVS